MVLTWKHIPLSLGNCMVPLREVWECNLLIAWNELRRGRVFRSLRPPALSSGSAGRRSVPTATSHGLRGRPDLPGGGRSGWPSCGWPPGMGQEVVPKHRWAVGVVLVLSEPFGSEPFLVRGLRWRKHASCMHAVMHVVPCLAKANIPAIPASPVLYPR